MGHALGAVQVGFAGLDFGAALRQIGAEPADFIEARTIGADHGSYHDRGEYGRQRLRDEGQGRGIGGRHRQYAHGFRDFEAKAGRYRGAGKNLGVSEAQTPSGNDDDQRVEGDQIAAQAAGENRQAGDVCP